MNAAAFVAGTLLRGNEIFGVRSLLPPPPPPRRSDKIGEHTDGLAGAGEGLENLVG